MIPTTVSRMERPEVLVQVVVGQVGRVVLRAGLVALEAAAEESVVLPALPAPQMALVALRVKRARVLAARPRAVAAPVPVE
jgi:hypothetical protein